MAVFPLVIVSLFLAGIKTREDGRKRNIRRREEGEGEEREEGERRGEERGERRDRGRGDRGR
jgi:hypothetical protein